MRAFMLIFYLILIFFGVSFAALNAAPVKINFYFTLIKMPVAVLMILLLGLGIIIGIFAFLNRYWHLKRNYAKIKNQLQLTEREIKNLRSIPLKD